MKDEDLQHQVEMGKGDEGLDAHAYKKVFEALKQEPFFHLPPSFADQVASLIEQKKENSRDWLWLGLGICIIALGAVVSVSLTGFTLDVGAFKFLAGYPGLIGFGLAFILFLHWVDRKLIREKHST